MNKAIFSYEDIKSDVELEIFGLDFEINFSEEFYKRLKDLEKNIDSKEKDYNLIRECVDNILGQGSFDKIKEKYLKDKGIEMGIEIIQRIFIFLVNESKKYFKRYNNYNNFNNRYKNNNVKYKNNRGYRRNDYRR